MPKRRSKTASPLASIAEGESIGEGQVPEIEQPVAALVLSPDEELRGNVRNVRKCAMWSYRHINENKSI